MAKLMPVKIGTRLDFEGIKMYRQFGETFSTKVAWLHLQQEIIDHVSVDINVDLEAFDKKCIRATIAVPGKERMLRAVPIILTSGEGLILLSTDQSPRYFYDRKSILDAIEQWATKP
jgi:hypothetical protein